MVFYLFFFSPFPMHHKEDSSPLERNIMLNWKFLKLLLFRQGGVCAEGEESETIS